MLKGCTSPCETGVVEYYPEGNKRLEVQYCKTGDFEIEYYTNGNVKSRIELIDDEYFGRAEEFFEDGNLLWSGDYENGFVVIDTVSFDKICDNVQITTNDDGKQYTIIYNLYDLHPNSIVFMSNTRIFDYKFEIQNMIKIILINEANVVLPYVEITCNDKDITRTVCKIFLPLLP